MKQLLLAALAGCLALPAETTARDGYRIQLKIEGTTDTVVYLAHYFGKSLPTIYKMDSAKINKKGIAIFNKTEQITGGLYMMLPASRNAYFEFILNNGDDLSLSADMQALPDKLKAPGSAENEDFFGYQRYLKGYAKKQEAYKEMLAKATTKADTTAVQDKSLADYKQLEEWRKKFAQDKPQSFISRIFRAAEKPQIPEGPHYLPNGKIDSNFAWRYYRSHFWDGFDFSDDRLIHAPILEGKLDEYFNKVVPQQEDTVIVAADALLKKMRGSENLFKFTLNWLSTNAQTSRVMGMDKVFVYLVENYYQKGEATWLSLEELEKYTKRAREIAPNIIGNPAPQLRMVDIDKKEIPLLSVDAKYTLLVFWEPTCGHCMQEIPRLDSAYRASLKARGVKIYAVLTDPGEETEWRAFIQKHHLDEWIHVYDYRRNTRYYDLYDVKATPAIFLIDNQKRIMAKKIDHTTVGKVLDVIERRAGKQ